MNKKQTLKEDLTEDKYFDDEDSNNLKIKQSKPIEQNEEIDEDPLDAYMKGLETTIKKETTQPKVKFLNKKYKNEFSLFVKGTICSFLKSVLL